MSEDSALPDEQVLAVRSATAAWLAREAIVRREPLTMHGTRDRWPPASLELYLYGDDHKIVDIPGQYAPYPWADAASLLDALGPWLGDLPWGERGKVHHAEPILRAVPEQAPVWCELVTPKLDRWRALPPLTLPAAIAALQRQGNAALLRDGVREHLPNPDARTLAQVWLGANAMLVPRSGLRFEDGIPVAIDLYIEEADAIDREMSLPWSSSPRVRFLSGSRTETWPALAAAKLEPFVFGGS